MAHTLTSDQMFFMIKLKKYFIFYWQTENYYVLMEYDEPDYKQKLVMGKVLYSNVNGKISEEPKDDFAVLAENFDDIIFQSNNLKKCLERLEILSHTNKYNI